MVLLERNVELRTEFDKEKEESQKYCEKIVNSIKIFVKNKFKTVKKWDNKEAFSAIVRAYTHQHDMNTCNEIFCSALGVKKRNYCNTLSKNLGQTE